MKRNKLGQVPVYKFQEGQDAIKVINSSDDWRTPKPLFEKLNDEFHFKLDIAADQDNHLHERFYSLENNALDPLHFWDVASFGNIPYSITGKFFEKAWWEAARWQVPVVLMVKVATSENYWSEYVKDAHVRFLKGRVKFWDKFNQPHYGATFGSAFVIWSPETYGNPKMETWDYQGDVPRKLF